MFAAFAILFGLGAFFAISEIFDDNDEETAEDTGEPEPPVEEETGITDFASLISKGRTLTATDGDDSILVEGDDDIEDRVVNLGDGDDTLTALDDAHGAKVRGGEGDDVLTLGQIERARVDAGPGDDLLILEGGNGYEEIPEFNGGEGDDTFEVSLRADTSAQGDFYTGGSVLTGGPGADTFHAVVDGGSIYVPDDEDPDSTSGGFSVTDFVKGEDVLIVDPHYEMAAGQAFLGARLVEGVNGAGNAYTNVILDYQKGPDEGDGVHSLVVSLSGASGLGPEDVIIRPEVAA